MSKPIDLQYNKVAKDAMLEFGKELLELAAENAEIKSVRIYRCNNHLTTRDKACQNCGGFINYSQSYDYGIDKQTILDTIKQIK